MFSKSPFLISQSISSINFLATQFYKTRIQGIQRICAGKAERERLTRRHPKSQAMARRPNRQIKPFESAQHDALRQLLKSQGTQAYNRRVIWNSQNQSPIDQVRRNSLIKSSMPACTHLSNDQEPDLKSSQQSERQINLSLPESQLAKNPFATKDIDRDGLNRKESLQPDDQKTESNRYGRIKVFSNQLTQSFRDNKLQSERHSQIWQKSQNQESQATKKTANSKNDKIPIVPGIIFGTKEVDSRQKFEIRSREEDQSLLLSNDSGKQRDDVTPLNEIAAIEKRASEFTQGTQRPGYKQSTDTVNIFDQHKINTKASFRSGKSAGAKRSIIKNVDMKEKDRQGKNSLIKSGLPKIQIIERLSRASQNVTSVQEKQEVLSGGNVPQKPKTSKKQDSPRKKFYNDLSQPKQVVTKKVVKPSREALQKQYQPMKNTVFCFNSVEVPANKLQEGTMSRNSPDARSPTLRNEAQPKLGLRKNLPHKTISVFTSRTNNHNAVKIVEKTNSKDKEKPRSLDESWAEYRDEGTSPCNFDNVSQRSLSFSSQFGVRPLVATGAGSKINRISMNQATIPELRISQEIDQQKGNFITKPNGVKIQENNGLTTEFMKRINKRNKNKNFAQTMPPSKQGVHQDCSTYSRENETIRRASQYSATDFGLTSDGILSHGETSPDVGMQKTLLPQYRRSIKKYGRTSQIENQQDGTQNAVLQEIKGRPKTQERKKRVNAPTQLQTQIKLEECNESRESQNKNGNVSFNKLIDPLQTPQNPGSKGKLGDVVTSDPPSPKSPNQFRKTASFEDESSYQGSAVRRRFRLKSGKDKMSVLREDTNISPASPGFPLQQIVKPDLIMKPLNSSKHTKTTKFSQQHKRLEIQSQSNSGDDIKSNQNVEKFAERQEIRKQRLPHSFLKQKIYYNYSVEIQKGQDKSQSNIASQAKDLSPRYSNPHSGEFDMNTSSAGKVSTQYIHLPQHQIVMDSDGNLHKETLIKGQEHQSVIKTIRGIDPNAILIQHQTGSFRIPQGSKSSSVHRSSIASSNKVEMPIDIRRYTPEKSLKESMAQRTASFAHLTSGSSDQVQIRVKRAGWRPQELLVQTNQQVINFKKVNMHKRILTQESRKACGDEDKLFKENQKVIASTFTKDRQSCHICKDKMEKHSRACEQGALPGSARSSQRKKRSPRIKKVVGKKKESIKE